MNEPGPDLSLSPLLSVLRTLPVCDDSPAQLKIGKQGVYLVRRAENVASFQVVPWEQLLRESSAIIS